MVAFSQQRFRNSKKQGDAGLGIAIGWFTEQGYTVCIPLTDSQDYDLVVEIKPPILSRVQVKTSTYQTPRGSWEVGLRTAGGNRSGIGKIKKLDPKAVDYLFIVTGDGSRYLIPSAEVCGSSRITLGNKYLYFRV